MYFDEAEKITGIVAVFSTILIVLINVWMIISIASDLFKFDVGQIIEEISEYGWRLPPEWVETHRAEIDFLLMLLLIILLIDTLMYTLYTTRKHELPFAYRAVISAIEAPVAFILFLAGFPYGIFFIFAVGALIVASIKRQHERIFTEKT